MKIEQLSRIAGVSWMGQFAQFVGQERTSVHALKFQSVVAPNGLISNLYGPVGKLHCNVTVVYIILPYLFPLSGLGPVSRKSW